MSHISSYTASRIKHKLSHGSDAGQAATLSGRPTPLTKLQPRQAALPIQDGRRGYIVPLDHALPAYLGSRLGPADAVAALPGMRDAVGAMKDCSTALPHPVAVNQIPHPSARPDGMSRHSEH
jgi:hypothetical protein